MDALTTPTQIGSVLPTAAARQQTTDLVSGLAEARAGAAHRILVVEDDPSIGRAMVRCFSLHGLGVTLAPSVAAGLGSTGPFACGVLDIELRDGDGVTLARQLLERGVLRRVLFFTGCSAAERLSGAARIGGVCAKAEGALELLRRLDLPGLSFTPGAQSRVRLGLPALAGGGDRMA